MKIFRTLTPSALVLLSSTAFGVDQNQVDGDRILYSQDNLPAYEVRVLPLNEEQAARLKHERDKHRDTLEQLRHKHAEEVQRILFADS